MRGILQELSNSDNSSEQRCNGMKIWLSIIHHRFNCHCAAANRDHLEERLKKIERGDDNDTENDSSRSCVTLLQAMRKEKKQFNEKKIEMFERQYAQEQERLAYEQEKLRLEQMKEDERIMMIDTTAPNYNYTICNYIYAQNAA
ncbi:Orotidine 5'-phosphate decarboxylase [Forsythia ovata]|uniref:Orotidine 5'-phosphate decarboxylase n=1 Tax=Forsythia ovata TaxID=205694 RepID=A0ABD1VK57_9LAMI